jgi:hypothetical protein
LRATGCIHDHPQRPVVVIDNEIGGAVIVEIARGKASPYFGKLEYLAARRGGLLVMAVAEIMEELLFLMQR